MHWRCMNIWFKFVWWSDDERGLLYTFSVSAISRLKEINERFGKGLLNVYLHLQADMDLYLL